MHTAALGERTEPWHCGRRNHKVAISLRASTGKLTLGRKVSGSNSVRLQRRLVTSCIFHVRCQVFSSVRFSL